VLNAGIVLLFSVLVLLYIYAGYPLLLQLVVWLRGPRAIRRGAALPRVSLVISAYNEAASIRAKLQNALAIDYPASRFEIAVISDASNDGTDDVVREFAAQGVRLLRQEERRGKTAGLNRFVPQLTGDVVVFSDANAMYAPTAIRMLVRNFADPQVGCVTGEARYLETDSTAASLGERTYWNYEILIKRLETSVGSMVGGDGAIYAIRRQLWRSLPEDAINDFLNPLQIVAAGWRGIYEPEAVCYEETAGGARTEYRRRVRIVSRSWRAVFQAPGVLNPFRVGLFTFSLISHKVLRWMTGVFVTMVGISVLALALRLFRAAPFGATLVLTGIATLAASWAPARSATAAAAYYVVISMASIVGIVKGATGRVSGVWAPPRVKAHEGPPAVLHFGPGIVTLAAITLGACAAVATLADRRATVGDQTVFWISAVALVYVYAGYPLLLALLRPFGRRAVLKSDIEPTVCLFIAANDEADVIEAKLRNSIEMNYPRERLSVVVASDGSVDGTNEIVRAFASHGVKLLEFGVRRGKIAAINEGIRAVDSEIVVFSDANTFLDRGAIKALVRNFADEAVGAVSGDVILVGDRAALGKSEDLYYRYERWLQRAESDIGSMLGVDGALYAIRRVLFEAPPADTILDDMAIPMAVVRAGRRVVFEPGAVAHERGCETAAEEFTRKARVVAGAVQFLLRRDSSVPHSRFQVLAALISHKALRWLSPVFAALAFCASVVLAPTSAIFLAAALAQATFLALGLLGCIPAIRRISPFGLAHYFWLVQTAAAVGFVRGVLGRQSVAWRRVQRVPLEVAR
jgi:cellulose synthase/poly-beta-1,6-N-acetylglucosamine synthase-like glycosyltransferase